MRRQQRRADAAIEVMKHGAYDCLFKPLDRQRLQRVVDAVVRLRDKLLPIDSKFPLEDYRRLVETGEDMEKDLRHQSSDSGPEAKPTAPQPPRPAMHRKAQSKIRRTGPAA
jgi:DNA-binding NtrC family response regulator